MPEESKTTLEKILELLEKCAKAAAAIGVLFYVTGLIVANQYLAQFDLSDFGSLKPKYVLTGAGTIFVISLVGYPGAFFAYMWQRMPHLSGKKRWVLTLFMPVFCGINAYGPLYELKGFLSERGERIAFSDSLLLITSAVILFILVSWQWLQKGEGRYITAILQILPFLGFSFLALSIIGKSMYGHFPEAVGGARPINAELVLNKDGAAFWAQTGVLQNDCNGCTRTLPVKIIYQNDEVMVVQAAYTLDQHEEQKLVILRKPLVEAILPVEKKRR